MKLFCGGVGDAFPDIANASRPMKKSEFDACAAKGVKDIIALKIGFDGIVIATDKDGADYNFKLEYLYLGLSAKVLRFSGSYLASARLPRTVQPTLNRLAAQTRDAYSVAVLEGDAVVIVARSAAAAVSTRSFSCA